MSNQPKDQNERPKKSSFWEKLSDKKASGEGGSLVNAIVRQAEKEASGFKKSSSTVESIKSENNERDNARKMLANSSSLLSFMIILTAGAWIYFFAMLNTNNYFHEKVGKENLATELNRKTELIGQLHTDNRDTKKFSKLIRIENLANRVLELDLENPILNYERPKGERVIPRGNNGGHVDTLLKTMDANGEVVYLSETEIRSLEDAHGIRMEFTHNALIEILKLAEALREEVKTSPEIDKHLENLLADLAAINPEEENFPSATLKSYFIAAQSSSKDILRSVKNANLENLVADIKKQVHVINISKTDDTTKQVVKALQTSLQKISAKRSSSFDTALKEIQLLNITSISDNEIYQKVIQITGNPRNKEDNSDLLTAAIIARNIGKVNAINNLRANKIAWSNVIDRIEKIVRLGSDLERDIEGTPTDANRDIDPNEDLVSLLSYSGKAKKNSFELRGVALGEAAYSQKSFTLLADLIDAYEGSKYFKDVSGFAFSKDEDREGHSFSPLNLKLTLQNTTVTDSRDTVKISRPKKTPASTKKVAEENINVNAIEEINFSFSEESEAEEFINSKGSFVVEEEFINTSEPNIRNDGEFINIFDALKRILNN